MDRLIQLELVEKRSVALLNSVCGFGGRHLFGFFRARLNHNRRRFGVGRKRHQFGLRRPNRLGRKLGFRSCFSAAPLGCAPPRGLAFFLACRDTVCQSPPRLSLGRVVVRHRGHHWLRRRWRLDHYHRRRRFSLGRKRRYDGRRRAHFAGGSPPVSEETGVSTHPTGMVFNWNGIRGGLKAGTFPPPE
jgi:hypothetical protein